MKSVKQNIAAADKHLETAMNLLTIHLADETPNREQLTKALDSLDELEKILFKLSQQ